MKILVCFFISMYYFCDRVRQWAYSMLQTRIYHSLQFDVAEAESDTLCYILMPEFPSREHLKWLESMADRFACTLVFVSGFDWDDSFSPWPAEGLKKGEWFKGSAGMTLSGLVTDFFPFLEQSFRIVNPSRKLVGVSLSGLFALWAAHKTDAFTAVASVSGSLWYDGFPEWVAKHSLSPAVGKVYLSLGEREKNTINPRMAKVEDATREVVGTLSAQDADVVFEMTPGSHFSALLPRLEKALSAILTAD